MTKAEVLKNLEEQGLDDLIELIEDAEAGELEELEIVESIGLIYDQTLNESLIHVLKELGVTITYVTDDEE